MFLPGCLETRYSLARDFRTPWWVVQTGAHSYGLRVGVFENYMSKGRGQQSPWLSEEINNAATGGGGGVSIQEKHGEKRDRKNEKKQQGQKKNRRKNESQYT